MGLAGGRARAGGSRRPGSHRSLCSALGELGLKLMRGLLANELSPACGALHSWQPLAARGVLKSGQIYLPPPETGGRRGTETGRWSTESKAAPAGFGKRRVGRGREEPTPGFTDAGREHDLPAVRGTLELAGGRCCCPGQSREGIPALPCSC